MALLAVTYTRMYLMHPLNSNYIAAEIFHYNKSLIDVMVQVLFGCVE